MRIPPAPHKEAIDPKSIQGLKYFKALKDMLSGLHSLGAARDKAGNRDLHFDQYVSLILLYFFNPTLTSMRSIVQASQLENVQKALGCKATSLGSFSEAKSVFDADCLKPIVSDLAARLAPSASPAEAAALGTLTAVDGSLLPALPKMFWALWNYEHKRAAKLHLHFEVFKSAPVLAEITAGQSCEKKSLHGLLEPGRFYVLDRGYEQFRLFQAIGDIGSSFVCCVREQVTWTVLRERELSAAARKAHVVADAEVDLGKRRAEGVLTQPYRVVIIERPSRSQPDVMTRLVLISNRMDLDAELIALAYHYRWEVEQFFRWLKCVLNCRHLVSTSQNGVELQVYTALVASLLITLWVGRKPTKRTYEMLCLYFQGWANLEELMRHIETLKPAKKLES